MRGDSELFIGLMSGTSLDGVDGVLADFSEAGLRVRSEASIPFPQTLTQEFLALNSAGVNELHRAALAGNALVRICAQVVSQLLEKAGVHKHQVRAIGVHGQTVRHQPQACDGTGYTLQLNNPALLAELTGIEVVADFRSRDVAAGGQGAPLVPVFHQFVFGQADKTIATLNLGGIANLTVVGPRLADDLLGFDCGPGNVLLDAWCQRHLGQAFDAGGAWAASGQVAEELLTTLLTESYFSVPPPKSTGRDLFNTNWLDTRLTRFKSLAPVDVQATLTELTARTCATSVEHFGADARTLIVCGGGVFNHHLMKRLQACAPSVEVCSSHAYGLPALQVEAAAFAWLARKTQRREPTKLEKITGARGARVLGAIYPA